MGKRLVWVLALGVMVLGLVVVIRSAGADYGSDFQLKQWAGRKVSVTLNSGNHKGILRSENNLGVLIENEGVETFLSAGYVVSVVKDR